ncbi:MAG: hypothetical protein HZB61_06680 [Nitrospirae bacterium]|nr:hypothetical protein [Nitrospirota bacterium]
MKNKSVLLNKTFLLSLGVFASLDILFVIYQKYYQYGLTTNTIALISIAQKYIRGEFVDAVNGAYAPLSSWLLIPFLKLGVAPIVSVYVLNLIIGLFFLVGIRKFSCRFEMDESLRNITSFIAVPIALSYALRDHTPDLLVVCTLVYYLYLIFADEYPDSLYKGILCGLIGGIGYLSKAFIFPFFISHFMLFNVFQYLRTKESRRNVLLNAILGIVFFSFISVPWIFAISNKYHTLSIGTSGEYNRRVIGPGVPDPPGASWYGFEGWRSYIRMAHPVYDQGFFQPPNKTALSVWEDFTYLTSYLKPWSPFDSWVSLKHQIKLIVRNIYYTVGIFEGSYSVFSSAIIIGYVLLCIQRNNAKIVADDKLYSLMTILLYSAGYILVHPDARYSWIINVLILLMGVHLLYLFFNSAFSNNARKIVLIAFFIISFVVVPINSIRDPNADTEYDVVVKKLAKFSSLTGNIASNEKFSETLKLLFYSNMKMSYFGQARKNISDAELEHELRTYNINFYLVWLNADMKNIPAFLSKYKEITNNELLGRNGSMPSFKIYSLKEGI